MGGRGSFVNISKGDFSFVEGGQTFQSVGMVDNVKVLVKTNKSSVKAPELSHSANSSYAIIQGGILKHLSFYDNNHDQMICVDFCHMHRGLMPHKHLYLDHSDSGIAPSAEELALANKIRKRFGIK